MPNINSNVLLSSPGKENRSLITELEKAVYGVLVSGQYILGEQVKLFEQRFAEYCKTKHCITTASGTDALILGLKALGCGKKDKVVTIPNAGFYSTAAIRSIGAEPVYVDVDYESMCMSTAKLEDILNSTANIKCIIATHLYGAVVNIDEIARLAHKYNVFLLEDCAQAHGADFLGNKAGTFGHIGAFSFYPTKNLGALGDGGAVITGSDELYENVKMLRQYGWGEKYKVEVPYGQNSRFDEIQASILNIKLSRLDEYNLSRKAIVARYAATPFKNLKIFNIEGKNYVAHLAIVRTKYRDDLKKYLLANNISCDIHYPVLDYQQPAYLMSDVICEVAETVVEEILTIPCHPSMTNDEVDYVINKLEKFDDEF